MENFIHNEDKKIIIKLLIFSYCCNIVLNKFDFKNKKNLFNNLYIINYKLIGLR